MACRNANVRYLGALFVIMAAQVAVLPNAVAYEQTRTEFGARLRLTSLPARVRLDTPVPGFSDGGQAALLRAILAWNSRVCSSPMFVATDEDDDVLIEIVTVLDGWKYGAVIAAHTKVNSDPYEGDIRHVVIEIDGQRKWAAGAEIASDSLDLESVLLHELGHALGLDHSRNSHAIMRAGIKPGQIRRNLHEDDLFGACDIIKYSKPASSSLFGQIIRTANKTPWPLVSVLMLLTGLLIVVAIATKRIFQRISLRRIGNPFS
jgi:Matrixin